MNPHALMRRCLSAAAALLLSAGALAVAAPSAAAQENDTDSLLIATDQEVDTFNPFKRRFVITYNTSLMTYETLVRMGADYEPEPGLATEWEESEDGLTWTFTIREGVEWSDGEPLTAQDVAYTYGLLIENQAIRDWNIDFAGNLVSAEAPDDTTFVLTLAQPSPWDVLTREVFVVPEHVWSTYPDPSADDANQLPLVGSGPFQVTEYETGEFITLEANEGYWDGAPGFDEVVFDYYEESDAAVAALEAGEVDIVSGLNPAQIGALEGQDGITVNNAQGRRYVSLTINYNSVTKDGTEFGDGHPALKDPIVRQAMHMAIDKQELVDTVLDGNGQPATSIIPEIFEQYHWDGGDAVLDFDIEAANALLDEAGYVRGDDGIRTMPGTGEPLSFRFYQHADSTDYATIAQFVSEWWAELGLEITPEAIEQGTLNDLAYLGEFDIAFSGWGVGPNPTEQLGMHTCAVLPTLTDGTERSSENNYCNAEFDALHEQQKVESDPEARAELVREQQRLMYEDTPVIYLYYQNVLEAYNSDKITGMTMQPSEGGMITGQQGYAWAYVTAQPADAEDEGGTPMWVWIAVAAAVVVVAAGAIVFVLQRRKTADERE
ncbi:ABC transporter substrate-binding protein [Glycomyces harbinensis]|uniref:Peptide/nickel transport system substrate-binding protein n=1 Tax=Glycomyces harbinensis TaxID=58114 RepID=A0A1G7AGC7_9ACTN|nr:ABC transporter substrate-binding protein [Glycomyces harbinensis]SDE13753.1 peptide/nickel transport system substrate-binding protein [Glycomyces harbinensis]